MKQILHIFRKDTRHFWPEILASVAVTVALVLVYPTSWRLPGDDPRSRQMTLITVLLFLLVPLTWWLLTARLVHDEGLVGQNQFWLTRPYEWKKLLAAKALFLVVWLYVPLILAQCALVVEAGLPLGHASGWFYLLLLDSGLAIVPLVALATVTANFARMTLALLGAVLVVVAAMVVFTMQTSGYEAMVPHPHRIISSVLLVVCGLVAIVLQYATRRVWLTRGLLLAAFALAIAAPIGIYAARERTIDRAYPTSGDAVQLAFAPDAHHVVKLNRSERPRMVYIQLPMQLSGVADGHAVEVDDVKFSIDAADGFHWTAPWWTAQRQRYRSGTHPAAVQIMMPRDLYEHYRSVPLTLHLALAVTELQAGRPVTVEMGQRDFAVPDVGVCAISGDALTCRVALGDPQLTYISTTWSTEPCSVAHVEVPAAFAVDWTGTAYHDPVEFGPISVQRTFAVLWPQTSDGHGVAHTDGIALCPGTPATFTPYNVIGRSQGGLTIPNFQFPAGEPR